MKTNVTLKAIGKNVSGKTRTMYHIKESLEQIWFRVKLDNDGHIIECN